MQKSILFTLLLVTTALSAQTIKLRGVVKDSVGGALELANVIAADKATGDIEGYAITNYEGRFQIDLSKNKTYNLQASFLGYETQNRELAVAENAEDINLDFTLNPLANQLDGVEIVYEMPVTVRGDTIVYNADSFNTGNEKKLGDVMKNLPGVEVNDDGEIQVEGKTVSKVMVEGKDFFDGDSKLATKNIPANAVDKVQVLRNYNEVGQMRGLGNDQDNIAINIKLKEGKKNFWFGEVTAGAGTVGDDATGYLVHPKLFYYSPEYSINLITDFNNIGEVPFTFRDYFNFTGGFRNFNQRGGTNFNISQSDLGFAVAQNNRANELDTRFGAANFSWQVNKTLDVSGFGILSDNRTNIVNNSIRQFIATGATENTTTVNDQRNQLGMAKISGVYKPNPNLQVDYDALVKTSKQTQQDLTTSSVLGDITEDLKNRPSSVNQNVNAYYTLNDKNIFAGQLQHLYQDEDPFYSAILQDNPFPMILPVVGGQSAFDINQQKNVRTHKLDAKIDHYYVLNNTSNLNFTLGSTVSSQGFDSSIFQLLDDGSEQDFDETPEIDGRTFPLKNDVKYNFRDVFFGIHYKLKTGKIILNPGLTLHNYDLSNEQLGLKTDQNNWNVLPDVNIIWELKKSENLRFNYSISAQYTDVNNYAEAFVFNDYNRLFRGNRFLENSFSHTYNLTYFSFNMFNYTNVSASINYNRRIEGIKNNSQIVGINQVVNPFNIDSNFPDETLSVFGRFSKQVKKLQFRTGGNISVNKTNNIINGQVRESESFTQNYNASVRSNFKEWPNFEAGYRLSVNNYDNGGRGQKFTTHRPYANMDLNFLKHFTLHAEWDYYNYTNAANTIDNTYSFVNADLYFQKEESPWEFKLQVTNLLDTEFINSDSFNEQFNTTTQYFVLPRIAMLVIKYNL